MKDAKLSEKKKINKKLLIVTPNPNKRSSSCCKEMMPHPANSTRHTIYVG